MHCMPVEARVAIATLYIRYRDARRRTAAARRQSGCCSETAKRAHDIQTATWNDLQAVITNVGQRHDGTQPLMATKRFVEMVARRGQALTRNEQRQACD